MGVSTPLVVAYASLIAFWILPFFMHIPVNVNLIGTTVTILYVACHRSLVLRDKNVSPPAEQDKITQEDAMRFPLVGSAVLFGLFLVLKFVDKEIVNLILSVYFSALGMVSVATLVEPIFVTLFGVKGPLKSYGGEIEFPFIGPVGMHFNWLELVCCVLTSPLAVFYFKTKHWLINNLFGIAFAIQGVEKISLGSFKIGAILLCGLFFYDIFWVFGTDKLLKGDSVMVTVAKSLEAPIKLLFPKAVEAASEATKPQFSLLGLGDIVIPGMFIALLIRFDAERAGADASEGAAASFSKPFFHTNLFAYVIGLGTTVFVMDYFKAAQPALLYLVPACLGAALLTALVRGQMHNLFAYDEEEKPGPTDESSETAAGASTEAKKDK